MDKDSNNQNQPKETNQRSELDNRYGKIGISAVAAAVRHQGEQRTVTEPRFKPYERD